MSEVYFYRVRKLKFLRKIQLTDSLISPKGFAHQGTGIGALGPPLGPGKLRACFSS